MINVQVQSLINDKGPVIDSDCTLSDAINKMVEYNEGFIIILAKNNPVGILTERDVVRLTMQKVNFQDKVLGFASRNLITVRKDRDLYFAINLMIENNIRRLVVVGEKGEFIGSITMKKILTKIEEDLLKKDLSLKDVNASKEIISVERQTKTDDVLKLFVLKNIGSVVITDNQKPIGIFTERDVLNKIGILNLEAPIENYMVSPVFTVDIETSVYKALKIMNEKNISRLLIVSDSKYVGFITQRDILRIVGGDLKSFLEKKLKHAKDVLDLLPELVIELIDFSEEQVVLWMNKKAKEKIGDFVGSNITTIIPERDWGYIYSQLLRHKKIERYRITNKSSIYEISGSYLFSDAKDYKGRVKLMLRDISEEYEKEKLVQKELQTYKSIINSIDDMIIIYQADNGKIKLFNNSVNKKLGYTDEELINMTIYDIVEEDEEFIKQNIEKIVRKGLTITGRRTYKEVHGERIPVEVSASSVLFNGVPHISIVARDISQRVKLEKEIEEKNFKIQVLHNFILNLNRATSVNEAYHLLAKVLIENIKIDKLLIYKINPSLNKVSDILTFGFDIEHEEYCINGDINECKVILTGNTILKNSEFDYVCQRMNISHKSFLCSKILSSGKVIGILNMVSNERNFFTPDKVDTIEDLVNAFSPFVSNLNLIEINKELALKDSLTNLYNRRFITEFFMKELEKAKRFNYDVGLLIIDVDNFKKLNDTYGHQTGDIVLKKISNVFSNTVRDMDVVGRWGGEEFIVILPKSDKENTFKVAERIIKNISSEIISIEGGKLLYTTVSIGMAVFPEDGENLDDLIKVADSKLYEAKKSGKNKVVG
ncbi:diguanylate cyclase [Sulfurihydrogenibium sp.]|uniref:diguanylate cyclase n=1 Tax=Sulfurihydrogenibium sp. TaxID=2053621 RepID=UPI002637131B|nr:diguanylate cyclase [Sulfurihydrogenibium sp.]